MLLVSDQKMRAAGQQELVLTSHWLTMIHLLIRVAAAGHVMARTMCQARHVFLVVFLFILIITIEALVMLRTSWGDEELIISDSPLAGFHNFQQSVQSPPHTTNKPLI